MIKTKRLRKKPPKGWELIEPTLEELEQKMRDAESEPHEGKRKNESIWPIFMIHHQRSRYIYEMYYKKRLISKELFDFCVKEKIADGALISKWRKNGYEKLCCMRCISNIEHNFGGKCICRVPKSERGDKIIECANCGCSGCASSD